jgi:hypothetical protein
MNYRVRQIKSLDSLSASEKESANEDTAQAKADCYGTVEMEKGVPPPAASDAAESGAL